MKNSLMSSNKKYGNAKNGSLKIPKDLEAEIKDAFDLYDVE